MNKFYGLVTEMYTGLLKRVQNAGWAADEATAAANVLRSGPLRVIDDFKVGRVRRTGGTPALERWNINRSSCAQQTPLGLSLHLCDIFLRSAKKLASDSTNGKVCQPDHLQL